MQSAASEEGGGKLDKGSDGGLDEETIERLEQEYGSDKPLVYAYGQWLGVVPREDYIIKKEFIPSEWEEKENGELSVKLVTRFEGREVEVIKEPGEEGKLIKAVYTDDGADLSSEGWSVRVETRQDRVDRFLRRDKENKAEDAKKYPARVVIFQPNYSGLFQLDFRHSRKYNDKVIDMIGDKVPISLYFGILSTIIIYGVCIPLGVIKAIKHRTVIDNVSSILIFIGYSIPSFALGAFLLVHCSVQNQWFPLMGLVSQDFEDLSLWQKIWDLTHHTVLPLICYVIGGFAMLTMMMKNNLMENLAADYVRTAVSKGVSFRSAVLGHAFRNSFIPIASGLGSIVTIFVSGSMLIEKVFDIDGFGLMQFQAILDKDMQVMMGTMTISVFLMLIGNVLSDFIVAKVDPRITYK